MESGFAIVLVWLEKFGSDPKVRSLNYALIAIAALGQFPAGIMLHLGDLRSQLQLLQLQLYLRVLYR